MNILVTGARGYIGNQVCRLLEKLNISFYPGTRDNFHLNDVRQMMLVMSANKITHVIHLAAVIQTINLQESYDTNLTGLFNLLSAIELSGIKHFVFASGNNVYGYDKENSIDEMQKVHPEANDLYAFSKYVGELVVKDFLQKRRIHYCIMRISDVYGPGQKYGNLIKTIVHAVNYGEPLKLYGKGKRTRDYIFVSDVAKGLVFAAEKSLDGVYNLSTGIGTNVKELVNLASSLGSEKNIIEYIPVKIEDETVVILDPKKLNEKGFVAKIDIEEGLRRCIEYGKECY